MSQVTTHVLDSARGVPAAGVPVQLSGPDGLIASSQTNADGRVTTLGPETLTAGAEMSPMAGCAPRSVMCVMNFSACTSSSAAWARNQPATPGRLSTSISIASWR